MNNYLKGLLTIGVLSMSISVQAAPILNTVSCDSTGLYRCLTSVENFQVGEDLYNANFTPTSIFTAFDVDSTGNIPTAMFWNNGQGAEAFASALADLLEANSINGFLTCAGCERIAIGVPVSYTFIPVYRDPTINLEISDCFVGTRASTGEGFHHCFFNPGSNNQNWAVITSVPEPATILNLGLGLLLLCSLDRGARASRRHRPLASQSAGRCRVSFRTRLTYWLVPERGQKPLMVVTGVRL